MLAVANPPATIAAASIVFFMGFLSHTSCRRDCRQPARERTRALSNYLTPPVRRFLRMRLTRLLPASLYLRLRTFLGFFMLCIAFLNVVLVPKELVVTIFNIDDFDTEHIGTVILKVLDQLIEHGE